MGMVATGNWKNKGSGNILFAMSLQANSAYYGVCRDVLYSPPPQFRVAKALLCDVTSVRPSRLQSMKSERTKSARSVARDGGFQR